MPEALERFENLLSPADLPSIGPEIRPTRLPLAALAKKLTQAFSGLDFSPATEKLIRSLVFLWHDHFAESHSLSQDIPDADGSFLHGILHRREPDYGNARYWFNRVGNHPAFPLIAEQVANLQKDWKKETIDPEEKREKWPLLFLPRKTWDPFEFIAACQRARENPSPHSRLPRLEKIQELEFRVLLARFVKSR